MGLCLVAVLGMQSPAMAATKLNVGSLSVDGQEVRQLSCEMAEGGLLATMTIVATLAKQKAALDRCAPNGAAFSAKFTWKKGTTSDVQVTGPATPEQNGCVAKVLSQISPRTEGSCSVIVLVGDSKGAQAAAAGLMSPQNKGQSPGKTASATAPAVKSPQKAH